MSAPDEVINLLDNEEGPTDVDQYEEYLRRFLRWVPRQSGAKAWQEQPGQSDELNDRTAHFYFLVDQEVDGPAPQDSDAFRGWMTEFSRQWGSFLDTPESFSPEILQSFIDYRLVGTPIARCRSLA